MIIDDNDNLDKCPRCGQGHKKIKITRFSSPVVEPFPVDPAHPCVYHFWTMCPVNNEPILIQDRSEDDVLLPICPRREDVEKLAHSIWEHEGKPEGKADEHWRMAEYSLTEYFRLPNHSRVRQIVERCTSDQKEC